jgi:hypothetical protein
MIWKKIPGILTWKDNVCLYLRSMPIVACHWSASPIEKKSLSLALWLYPIVSISARFCHPDVNVGGAGRPDANRNGCSP